MIADNAIMLNPIAQITCKLENVYARLNVRNRPTAKISIKTSQAPRVKRKKDNSLLLRFRPYRYEDVPARKTKTGAQ
jgi:hypothetical protein